MMVSSWKHIVCIGACAALLAACSGKQGEQMLGALVGGAAGAATGALAGKGDTTAILAGAAAGATVGWAAVALTQYHAEKTASAQQEANALGYNGSDGILVKIRGIQATPDQVRAGSSVALATDYAVLAPYENANIGVRETLELWKDNQLLQAFDSKDVQRQPGGYSTKVTIPLPSQAPAGTYVLKSRVEGGGSYDVRETHFVVAG